VTLTAEKDMRKQGEGMQLAESFILSLFPGFFLPVEIRTKIKLLLSLFVFKSISFFHYL
jgi:hypothetical protein